MSNELYSWTKQTIQSLLITMKFPVSHTTGLLGDPGLILMALTIQLC